MHAIIVHKKFWGLQMLTWGWLARAKHELTKPKSTFHPQNFLSGLRAPHEQSFPFPTGAVVYAHFLGGGPANIACGTGSHAFLNLLII